MSLVSSFLLELQYIYSYVMQHRQVFFKKKWTKREQHRQVRIVDSGLRLGSVHHEGLEMKDLQKDREREKRERETQSRTVR